MNKRVGVATAAVVVLGVAVAAGWWFKCREAAGSVAGATQAAKQPEGSGKADGKKDTPLEFIAAEVTRPQRSALPQSLSFSGPLVAPATAVVRAKASGRLLTLTAAEGQRVKAGQVLGSIDQADQSSRVAERAALVESARAALAQAERSHAQNERLAHQSFISLAALDSTRAAVQTAQAQLDAAQAALNTSRVALRDGALVAPISGIVARRQALPGEAVAAEQPVLTLVDLSRLELAGTVATHEVSRLAPGMAVQVTVEGHTQAVDGRIARIAPAAEPGTRSIGVIIELANPKELYRAGQYALATVTLSDAVQRWVLPVAAVGATSGQSHVWTIVDGKLMRRAVTLGRRDDSGGRVEVIEGLAPEAVVLAARFDNLREGALAKVVDARAAMPVASAASGPTGAPQR
ncbi:MAG: efflux RND transporter periplasmic adaptor subunit [Rubrivivax sp.]|nr:efflux RND transporter periplasmic adaptor subunit [Rubrivivax sp.]